MTLNKKEITDALTKAMNKEDLHTRDAAKYLNINPCYISMARNQQSWDSLSKAAWMRLEEWYNSNSRLSLFQIPSGEAVFVPTAKPKEKELSATIKMADKIPQFHEPPAKEIRNNNKPPKFNYDFLKDTNFMNFKEKEAEFMDLAGRLIEKLDQNLKVPVTATLEEMAIRQNIAIDIEINLVINGQKIRLQ